MSRKSGSSGGGIVCGGVLQIVFIVLKLTHLINWSWWWVMSPTLITVAFLVTVAFIVCAVAALIVLKSD